MALTVTSQTSTFYRIGMSGPEGFTGLQVSGTDLVYGFTGLGGTTYAVPFFGTLTQIRIISGGSRIAFTNLDGFTVADLLPALSGLADPDANFSDIVAALNGATLRMIDPGAIVLSNLDDLAIGSTGDDFIFGGDGDDFIRGGDGNDELFGGIDNDRLEGGNGNDDIYGDEGDDNLFGEAGDDLIYAGVGDNTVRGGAGNDRIYTSDFEDGDGGGLSILALDPLPDDMGNDDLIDPPMVPNEDGDNTLAGGAGDDEISAGSGDDLIFGGADNDRINGGGGADRIRGGTGNDDIYGGDGDDDIFGQEGDDSIFTGAGNNTVRGGDGDDLISANDIGLGLFPDGDGFGLSAASGPADGELRLGEPVGDPEDEPMVVEINTLSGGAGNDTIFGGNSDDFIFGGADNDMVDGGNGDDLIRLGAGDDFVILSGGNNEVQLGEGNDVVDISRLAAPSLFEGASVEEGRTVLRDFNVEEDSIFVFDPFVIGPIGPGGPGGPGFPGGPDGDGGPGFPGGPDDDGGLIGDGGDGDPSLDFPTPEEYYLDLLISSSVETDSGVTWTSDNGANTIFFVGMTLEDMEDLTIVVEGGLDGGPIILG